MGFYAPSQRFLKLNVMVNVRPIDVNFSDWDHRLESDPDNKKGYYALRLGLRLVKGLSIDQGKRIVTYQTSESLKRNGKGRLAFLSPDDVMQKAGVSIKSLQMIANADGFSSLNIDRRQALWAVQVLKQHRMHDMPLFSHAIRQNKKICLNEPIIKLPEASLGEQVTEDYRSLGLSLKAHPLDVLKTR